MTALEVMLMSKDVKALQTLMTGKCIVYFIVGAGRTISC